MIVEETVALSEFETEVLQGLQSNPKRLQSKYFYDEKGDKLFQEIMKLEEYYLTRCEFEILSTQKQAIVDSIDFQGGKMKWIEFGAGDGLKTKLLLQHLVQHEYPIEYLPIDISASVLEQLSFSLKEQIPQLKVELIADTYFSALQQLNSSEPKVVLFLGSNIGNFTAAEAKQFLQQVYEQLNEGDYLLLGVDLKKQASIILDAYNDKKGVTRAFNLNLLDRINRELGADFDSSQFEHFPTYDPISGETTSFLISLTEQEVVFEGRSEKVHFKSGEPIFMEISKKYDIEELENMLNEVGFNKVEHFLDCKHYFVDTLWKK